MSQENKNEFEISRVFDAPRSLVWKARTESEHLAKWWGPKAFKMIHCKADVRPGGKFHYGMESPDGKTIMWGLFVYREVIPEEKIVFVNSFSDEKGGITANPWMPNWPLEILNTLTLTEENGKTKLTLRGGPINCTDEERQNFLNATANMTQGFKGTFDQLDEYLATKRD